ncbi:MAG: hypothetical protein ACJA1A_000526 [Saprospiraceae bacterium]|jgi:hypothetical protein
MKNLFFVMLLTVGFSVNSYAQDLDYWLYNISTTDTWDFAMDDASPLPAVYELGMGPRSVTTGTYGSTFALPLEWKTQDSNGCYVTGIIPSAPFSGSSVTTCGTTVDFKIQQSAPFLFELKFSFS